MIESLILSLILTVIIEVILSFLIGLKAESDIEAVILINCVTNPIVVGTVNAVYIISKNLIARNVVLAILEIIVIFAEGILFKKNLKNLKINPLLYSLYLNGLSFGIGLILNFIIK